VFVSHVSSPKHSSYDSTIILCLFFIGMLSILILEDEGREEQE
jgi:hypothetical protein